MLHSPGSFLHNNSRVSKTLVSVKRIILLCIVAISFSSVSFGQWTNTLEKAKRIVVDTHSPYNITSLDNPGGGFYVVWQDKKEDNVADIYFQSIELSGRVKLRGDGKKVSFRTGGKDSPVSKVNADGQLFVLWKEVPNSASDELHMQKILENGYLQWSENGIPVYKGDGHITNYSLSVDSAGGAYVSYIEKSDESPAQYSVKVQKINADGNLEMSDTSVVVSHTKEQKFSTHVIPDQKQGAFIFWLEARQGKNVLFVNHIDRNSNKSYFTKPVEISTGNDNILSYAAASLKNGQVTILWQTGGKTKELFFQSIDEKGKHLFNEPKKIAPRVKGSKSNIQMVIAPDNSLIVSWINELGKMKNVYCQRITQDGKLNWGEDAEFVSKKDASKFGQALTTDKLGGIFVTWFERGETAAITYVYAQKFNREGHRLWDSLGVPMLLSKESEKSYLSVISDKKQGIIAILKESGKSGTGIYAQRLFSEKKSFTPLLDLSAGVHQDSIVVSWKVGGESMVKAFRIEKFILKSIHDTTWSEVSTIPAKLSPDGSEYNFAFIPDTDGVYFVRVLQIADNAIVSVSEIEKVSYLREFGDKIIVLQNVPNPFSDSTVINYYLPESMIVRFEFYNSRIEKIEEAEVLNTQKGRNAFVFRAKDYPSGIYFFRFTARDVVEVKKFVIEKAR